jgi:hypothetical protein
MKYFFNLSIIPTYTFSIRFKYCVILLTYFFISNTSFANEFFPALQEQGSTVVIIHPIESVHPNEQTLISFGVPFPKGYMINLEKLRVLNGDGDELAIFTKELSPWRNLAEISEVPSTRSALVQVYLSFSDINNDGKGDPLTLIIEWGIKKREIELLSEVPIRQNWALVDDELYPKSESIYEPRAFAAFTPAWYGLTVLKTRLYAAGTHHDFSNYEYLSELFSNTVLNKVDPRVSKEYLNDYISSYSSWLFGRPMALYQVALKSGNVKLLREAHRASQFYSQHINADGYFDLKSTNDLKYSSIEGIATNYWLTGDPKQLLVAERMGPVFESFDMKYTLATNFWTERHAATTLSGLVVTYELFGNPYIAQKATNSFTTLLDMQNNPVEGAPNNGALMHTSASAGEGGDEFISSPWMTALLIDAVERYYIHSSDQRVKTFVYKIADYMGEEGIYYSTDFYQNHLPPSAIPYYLSGENLADNQRDFDPWSNVEHSLDVSKIFALAYFFARTDDDPIENYIVLFSEMYKTAMEFNLPNWIRPAAPSAVLGEFSGGKQVFRTSPPRKFNWWFRTTANLDWLIGGDNPITSIQDVNNQDNINAVIETTITANKESAGENELITFTITYENIGSEDAMEVSIRSFIDTNLDYFEVLEESISHNGQYYLNEIFWTLGSIPKNSGKQSLSFQLLTLKPDLVFTDNRPSPSTVVRVISKYGNIGDIELQPSINLWDKGIYTHSRVGNIEVVSTNESFVNKHTIAIDQYLETNEDTPLGIELKGSDPENQLISFVIYSDPLHGQLSGIAPDLIYIPNKDYFGEDRFEYFVLDPSGGWDNGLIKLTVKPENDGPIAINSSVTVENGESINIELQGQDVDSALISFFHTSPEHGILTGENEHLVYTADPSYQGDDSFSFYVIDDNGRESNHAEVQITVIPFNIAPIAESRIISLVEDGTVALALNASDIDSALLTYSIATHPLHGELTGGSPNLSYKPHANFVGEDSFTFIVSDGHKSSEAGVITLNVTNENDAPIAKDIYVETYMTSSIEIDLTSIDPDLDSLLYEIILLPGSGEVLGGFPVVTYQPDGMNVGQAIFTYQVFDGQEYSQANVYIDIKDGSEFRLYIESAIEEGNLASWIGNYVIARFDLYQQQVAVIKDLHANPNSSMNDKIQAWHLANIYIYDAHSYLNYAPKNEVYDYIGKQINKLLFNTLSSTNVEFKESSNYLYQKLKSKEGHGWPIGESIKYIGLTDFYYAESLLNEENSIFYLDKARNELNKLVLFITPYTLESPENEVYQYIQTAMAEKLADVINEVTGNVDFKTYLETVITENNLPSWIGNYVLGRLSLYQNQLAIIDTLIEDPSASVINNILAKHKANMYIVESYSYLNYASKNQYFDYIDSEITHLLLNTLSSNELDFQVAQNFVYTQLRERNGHGWPLVESMKYIIILDYHYSQHITNTESADEHLILAKATLQQAIKFIDSYIEKEPDNEAYKSIREIFEITLLNKIY